MRSLMLRWGVAVVVGTLWGAILSPASAGTHRAKTTALISDAAHGARPGKRVHPFASSGDNRLQL